MWGCTKVWGHDCEVSRPQRAGPREFPYESKDIYNQLLEKQCVSDASKCEIASLGDAVVGKGGSLTVQVLILLPM